MIRTSLTGAAVLMLIATVPASAAHKRATRHQRTPVRQQLFVPGPYRGVQQPRMLGNSIWCIGGCGQYSHPMPSELPGPTPPPPPDPPPPPPFPIQN
jgi:hypothetical protein